LKALWLIPFSALAAFAGAPVVQCDALASKSFGDDVKIQSVKLVAARGNNPEHCDVRGVIWPEAQFALKMPTQWNDRFQMVGNGGTAGTISMGAVDGAIRKGFASVSTDTGHDAKKEEFALFANETPRNPNARRKFLDFAYLAVHETAVLAKHVIGVYYGVAPKYSYWVGCSTGGRQGMQEAQRYPEDFDGLVIGAPGLYNTGNGMRRIWAAQSQLGDAELPIAKLPLLAKIIYDKCDPADGLKDGVIEDPRKCKFDARRDLPKCKGADAPECFTQAQIGGIARIHGGVRDSKGKLIFPGEPVGAESVWAENVIFPTKTVLPRSESQMKYFYLDPPPGPDWKFTMFNFDVDPPRTVRNGSLVNAMNTDLAPLKKRGGKIVHYSGWADQQVNPLPGIEYHQAVTKRLGETETRDFYRLFMVPGMFHCNGGPGCSSADWLAATMDWVEKGIAPETILGSHMEGGKATRTRPLCTYPQIAKYKGSGSIEDAANFSCQAP